MAHVQQLEPRLVLSSSPVAVISGPSTATAGQQVTFSAAGSYDPDYSGSLYFSWDLDGDGNFWDASGESVMFDPSSYGSTPFGSPRTIGVRVSDMQDPDSTASAQLTVTAPPPALANVRLLDTNYSPVTSPYIGDYVTLKADASSFMGDSLSYTIAWGDGTANTTGSLSGMGSGYSVELSADHTYNAAGNFTATLTLTGAGGSVTQTLSINVQPATFSVTPLDPNTTQEPTSWMSPSTAPAVIRVTRIGGQMSGNTVQFTLAGTASPSDYTLSTANSGDSYALVLPNGTTPGSLTFQMWQSYIDLHVTPTFGPETEGAETVILTLIDNDPNYNLSGNPSAEVTITDSPPPEFTIEDPDPITEGTYFYLGITATAPIDRYEVVWDYNPTTQAGSPAETIYVYGQTQSTLTHLYYDDDPTNTPSDTVEIRITAYQGNTAFEVDPVSLTIDNVAPTWLTSPPANQVAFSGQTVLIAGRFFDVPASQDSFTYTIVWGDGAASTGAATSWDLNFSHQYLAPGLYEGVLSILDDDGGLLSFDFQIDVLSFVHVTEAVGFTWEGAPLHFLVQAEGLHGQTILSYEIDANGDGGTDLTVAHDPAVGGLLEWSALPLSVLAADPDDGQYPGSVLVRSSEGFFERVPLPVHVGNTPHAVLVDGPTQLDPGETATWGFSLDDPGPDTVSQLVVDWGDGASETLNSSGGSYQHTYAATGKFVITATVTDEDGTWRTEYLVNVGDTAPSASPDMAPQIVSAEGVLMPEGDLAVTVVAVAHDSVSPVQIDWDLDLDGTYELQGLSTVVLPAGTDAWRFIGGIRLTDPAGSVEWRLLANGPGLVEIVATLQNYRKLFLELTPDIVGTGWEIHHRYQAGRIERPDGTIDDVLGQRYLKERGINVHSAEHLRAVHPKVHAEITARQNDWWNKQMKELGETSREAAYRRIDLAKYDTFVAELDEVYKSWWIKAGRNQAGDIAKITNRISKPGGQWSFVAGKAGRAKKLGIGAALVGIGLFDLFTENARAAANIAHHNPEQMANWDAFAASYDRSISEIIEIGRLKHNTALHLRDSFLMYKRSLGLNGDVLNAVDASLGVYIDLHLNE